MPSTYQSIPCDRYRAAGGWERVETRLIAETSVTLTVNGQAWLSFACTPTDLDALAAGFLFNEGVIQSREEIALVDVCGKGTNVDVWLNRPVERPASWQRTSGCGGGFTAGGGYAVGVSATAAFIPATGAGEARTAADGPLIRPETVLRCMDLLLQAQALYRETGGVHTSILCDPRSEDGGPCVCVRAEDIGRHNTLDKLAGRALLDGIHIYPAVIATTGRISSEMLQKSARLGAAVVISRTSPTTLSQAMAEQLGITLIGYARRDGFLVYAHAERLAAIPAGEPALLPGETPPDHLHL